MATWLCSKMFAVKMLSVEVLLAGPGEGALGGWAKATLGVWGLGSLTVGSLRFGTGRGWEAW